MSGDLVARVYRLLRQHPEWSGEQLAETLDVARGDVVAAVDELSTLRLIRPAGASGWVVIEPLSAVEQLMADHTESVASLTATAQRMSSDAQQLLDRLPSVRAAAVDSDISAMLEGNETARAYLAELASTVRHELIAVHPGGGLRQETIDAALPADLALLERGVAVRTLYQASAVRHRPTLTYLERLAEAGAAVRIRDALPFRLVLADGATAVCSMKWAEGRSGAVVVRGSALLHLLRRVFDFCWADATALGSAAPVSDADLDDEQQLLIRLLADGATDQAIARHLGIAPRTCTRKLRTLFDTLGVDSRFQAGAEAVRRGLV